MLTCIRSAGIMSAGRHVDMYTLIYIYIYKWLFADLLTGLIMYKGLFIHLLSVWIYKLVGRYHCGRWQDIHTFTYICGYMPIHQPTSNPEYTYRAYHLYWLVYTLICMDIHIV